MGEWYDGERVRSDSEEWERIYTEGAEPDEVVFEEDAHKRSIGKTDDHMNIGRRPDSRDGAATLLECKQCGGREFNVGRDSWYTAIRCPNCEWEFCIHEG